MSVVNVKNFTYNTNDIIGKGATGSVYKGREIVIKELTRTMGE